MQGEPLRVVRCHCDFCQKRTGSLFSSAAHWAEENIVSLKGETTRYNGLELDGVNAVVPSPEGITFHFCPTCGSTLYWDWRLEGEADRTVGVGVGNFVDPRFPMPTIEFCTTFRHDWISPVPGADQF